jgi:hypothetical protein
MALPPDLLAQYHQFYQLYGPQVSSLHQLALADHSKRLFQMSSEKR